VGLGGEEDVWGPKGGSVVGGIIAEEVERDALGIDGEPSGWGSG
jgi:hypothetical protein